MCVELFVNDTAKKRRGRKEKPKDKKKMKATFFEGNDIKKGKTLSNKVN